MATIRNKKNGHYQLIVSSGYDSQGKRVRYYRTVYVDPKWTEKNQKKKLDMLAAAFEAEVKCELYNEQCNDIFDIIAERWLECKKISVEVSTYGFYRDMIRGHIKNELGCLRLKQINVSTIEDFYMKLKEIGLNNNSIKHYHVALSQIFDDCLKKGYIKQNPCKLIILPKVQKCDRIVFNEDEIMRFVEALNKENIKYKLAYSLFLLTGCIREEIAGLMWNYVDLENMEISVMKANVYCSGFGIVTKTPQTNSSIRKIVVNAHLVEMFKEYKAWQDEIKEKLGDQWRETGFVFTAWNGLPIYPVTFTKDFKRFLKANNLPNIRLHDLRHTVQY